MARAIYRKAREEHKLISLSRVEAGKGLVNL